MAYVPSFKYDIFISYAHADNAADPQGVEWVSDFQVFLKRTVKQHLAGYEPDVFFDALDLHPNHPIQVVLANARLSAVFLPIISPSYVERQWPNDELTAFSEATADPDRIFAVELLPPIGEYPVQLRNLRRQQFWRKDEKHGSAPRKLTPKYNPEAYTDCLDDVAYLIAKRLRQQHPQGDPEPRITSGLGGKTILLAEVTDDLRRTRRQVRQYMEQFGANVLPKLDYPERPADFIRAFDADLSQANLFVQLLSEVRSAKWPEFADDGASEPKSQGRYQYDAAKRKGIPALQWRGPEVDISTVTHWDQPLLCGPQVLVTGLQEFVKEIKKVLERPAPETPKSERNAEFIFVDADSSDEELTEKLLKAFEHPDRMVMGPLFKGSPDRILRDLEANLKDCAALLVVYGNSEPDWVRAQLRLYHKLEKFRTEAPRLKTILLGPPPPKSERDLGWAGGFMKLDCQNGITVEHLKQIVAELRR